MARARSTSEGARRGLMGRAKAEGTRRGLEREATVYPPRDARRRRRPNARRRDRIPGYLIAIRRLPIAVRRAAVAIARLIERTGRPAGSCYPHRMRNDLKTRRRAVDELTSVVELDAH